MLIPCADLLIFSLRIVDVSLDTMRVLFAIRGKREIAGVRKPGRRPRVASNAEVRAALVIRLRAFGIRVSGEPALLEAPAEDAGEGGPE